MWLLSCQSLTPMVWNELHIQVILSSFFFFLPSSPFLLLLLLSQTPHLCCASPTPVLVLFRSSPRISTSSATSVPNKTAVGRVFDTAVSTVTFLPAATEQVDGVQCHHVRLPPVVSCLLVHYHSP